MLPLFLCRAVFMEGRRLVVWPPNTSIVFFSRTCHSDGATATEESLPKRTTNHTNELAIDVLKRFLVALQKCDRSETQAQRRMLDQSGSPFVLLTAKIIVPCDT